MSSDFQPESTGRAGRAEQWDRVSAELRAAREAQRKAWGDTDNLLLGRYLAGDATADERRQVEAALEQHPDLRLLTEVVSEVLADCPTVEATPQPAILPFTPRPTKPRVVHFTRRRALLAAACLLLAIGIPALGLSALSRLRSPEFAAYALGPDTSRDLAHVAPSPPKLSPPGAFEKKTAAARDNLPAPPPPSPEEVRKEEMKRARREEAEQWIVSGKSSLDVKQYDKAAEAFDRAVKLREDDDEAKHLFFRARDLAVKAKEKQVALRDGEQALKDARYDDAVKAYTAALRLEPDDKVVQLSFEQAKKLAQKKAGMPPHVAAKVGPEAKTDAERRRFTDVLRSYSPLAGSVAETLTKLAEHSAKKQK